jgi:hypothetical protein
VTSLPPDLIVTSSPSFPGKGMEVLAGEWEGITISAITGPALDDTICH